MTSIGFARDLVRLLRCRLDGGFLSPSGTDTEPFLSSGVLACNHCGARYALTSGILDTRLTKADLSEVMEQERAARDEGAGEYDAYTEQAWYRAEIPSTLEHLTDLDGKLVAEFGSGTGRFTTTLVEKAAAVIAIDFSQASHQVLMTKLGDHRNVGLVCGDVSQVKLAPESVDIAVSTQLLQHIPTQEKRRTFLENVYSCLKPGGYFLLTAYYQDMRRRMTRQPQEGIHDSGIFFHHFSRRELQREFSRYFDVVLVKPFLFHVPMIWRLEAEFPWIGTVCDRTPFLREFGSLIMIKGFKRG